MIGIILVNITRTAIDLYLLVIFLSALLSFFLPPYHQVRVFLDKLVDPLLRPIRRVVPLIGNLDISPMILFILVQLVGSVLVRIFYSL